jgi:ribosome maturation factor RimP
MRFICNCFGERRYAVTPKSDDRPGGVAAVVDKLVRPVGEEMGLVRWDVRFEKEGPRWFLRVLVERPGQPMDTDTCEAVSRRIDPLLDEADPIEQSYCLEVGSPGLGRLLNRPWHFEALAGRKVRAKLYAAGEDGQKEPTGILLGLEGGAARLRPEHGGEVEIPLKAAAFFRLCDDEDLFSRRPGPRGE